MPKNDLQKLSDAELEKAQHKFQIQQDDLRQEGLKIQAELDRRAVLRKVEAMSDAERAALTQIVEAEGIEAPEEEKA